jgi:mRNA interferase MazF
MASRFMTKGRIVLIPFPFDDLTESKVRPAVCLTEPVGSHRHVILGFISSQVTADISSTDILLDPRSNDFIATGLRVASVLRLHRLVTVTMSLIRRDLGKLSPSWQEEVNKKLMLLFQLRTSSK